MKKPRSARALREEATKLLKANRVKAAPVPVTDIATSMGARISYSPFEGELAGMLVRDHDQTVIGVNSLHHPNRQRFTIAHECAHLALHEGEVHIDRSFNSNVRVNRRDAVSSMAVDAKEIEANRFAAELLMPYNMVLADLKERPMATVSARSKTIGAARSIQFLAICVFTLPAMKSAAAGSLMRPLRSLAFFRIARPPNCGICRSSLAVNIPINKPPIFSTSSCPIFPRSIMRRYAIESLR